MKKNSKKFYTEDEVLDELIGKIGTPERDEFETKLKKEVDEYHALCARLRHS